MDLNPSSCARESRGEVTQELRRAVDDERFLFHLGFNHCFMLGKHLLNNSPKNLNFGWH
jgi:hypothetical protein